MSSKYVYLGTAVDGERYEHRIVWQKHNGKIPKDMQVHHVNGQTKDNRIENLQLVTRKQNLQRKNFCKGYRIVKSPRPYRAYRKSNGKSYELGQFVTACGAKMAYNTFFIGGQYV